MTACQIINGLLGAEVAAKRLVLAIVGAPPALDGDDIERAFSGSKTIEIHPNSPVLFGWANQLTGALRHLHSGVTAVRARHLIPRPPTTWRADLARCIASVRHLGSGVTAGRDRTHVIERGLVS